MAFSIRNLSVLAYANGFTLWHYKAGLDRLQSVVARDFFADAADMLTTGDLLMISAADGARVVVAAPMEDGLVVTAPLS
ncbi:MAG TPA: hypothetical protein VGL95_16495 [Acetobacteraceae bacterium]|jgi:hypothetical protein